MNSKTAVSPGTIAGWKDTLVKDLADVVGSADELLKELANTTSDEYAEARTTIEAKLGVAKSRLHDARVMVSRKSCHAADVAEKYAKENPWKLLGAASAVGAVIFFLLDRR